MNVLAVPTHSLDPSLLDRLAASVDFPVKHKVAINNGKPEDIAKFAVKYPDWQIVQNASNLGVAGCWNLVPKLFPNEQTWIIMNDDTKFEPTQLEAICEMADSGGHHHLIMPGTGYDAFVWTKKGLEEFGTFDENYFPAYYEDWDLRFRHKLGGASVLEDFWPVFHHKNSGGQNWNGWVQGACLFNRAYFLKKWGTLDIETPVFTTPYNNPNLTLRDWQFDAEHRKKIEPLWETFLSMPNPSIYT